jgi:TolB-like protein/DNA-binding winged helix-turn-helix (wHTH) protein/Tfp pilus assembly protein PilF
VTLYGSETGVPDASGRLWSFAGREFDESRLELRVNGKHIELELKPLEVLIQLLIHAGEVVTKDQLLDAIWPGLSVVDGSLATAIHKLRKALGDDDSAVVVTVPRVGYRLAAAAHSKASRPSPFPVDLSFKAGNPVPGREHWRLVRPLDASTNSEVWLAEHPKTRELRVFKFVSNAARLKALKREVTAFRFLRESLGERAEFVRIFEWNFDTQPYFLESEYGGPNLAEWAEIGGGLANIPLQSRVRVLAEIAQAVAAAHVAGVLHKDLKPANVLVTPTADGEGRVKIADFGSASLLEASRLKELGITNLGLTQTGDLHTASLTGTLMYLAPEVLCGQSPTASADVYALGVMLYQLVVGDFRKPFAPAWESGIADPLIREDIAQAVCGDPAQRLAGPGDLAERLLTLDRRRLEREQIEQMHVREQIAEGKRAGARARRPWLLVAALALLVVLVAGSGLYRRASSPNPTVGASRITSLAVVPLANMTGDPAQDYFVDGMTEELITDLSKIRTLKVISRTSVMQYKGAKKTLPQIARELNVDGILEGAVLRTSDRVRVTAQLIRADTDEHIWAESYERDLQDVLNLQRELARQISREIKVTLQPLEEKQLAAPTTVNPQAHELYLRGRFFWNRRTREDLFKAADYFHQATEIDPSYAQAYAGLADAYAELVGFGDVAPAAGLPKAKAAAMRAIELDESLAEAHAALAYGNAADWNWAGAEKEFQRALELKPGYAVALYQYGFILSTWGRQDEAIALTEKALELDPLSQIALYRAGRVYFNARQYEKAIQRFERILELNPNDYLGLYGLGLTYEAEGRFDKAIFYFQKQYPRQDLEQGFDLAVSYAAAGRKADARRKLSAEMQRLTQKKLYIRPACVAEVYVSLGDKDEAMRWLERAYRERDAWLALLKVQPRFDPLRSDPRFQDLLRRMNFPP